MRTISNTHRQRINTNDISNRLSEIYCLIEDNKPNEAKAKILVLQEQIMERRTETTQKELAKRKNSKRAQALHNINDLLNWARKNNKEDKVKEYLEKREIIKNTIFD